MQLTEEQRAAVEHRGASLIVSAAAGAGKTAVLTQRVLSLLCDGENPCGVDQLLVVTFTNAAAAELRVRIGQALTERLALRPDDRGLRRQLALLGNARIGTVHGFCHQLLRQNFFRCGLAPDFRLIDDAECGDLRERALGQALEELYSKGDTDFLALARNMSDGRSDRRLEGAVLELFDKLRSHPDPNRWLEYAPALAAADPDVSEWCLEVRREARERLRFETERLTYAAEELAGTCAEPYKPYFTRMLEYGHSLDAGLAQGWDEARVVLDAFDKGRIASVRGGDKDFLDRMKRARDRFTDCIGALREDFSATEDDIRAESGRTGPLTAALCRAVQRFTEKYDALKRGRNTVDFSDLEHFALALLQEGGEKSTLAKEISASLREVLVDEYQDTNEVQERIFRLVTPEDGESFFVGDVKQSVYRFRLADPRIFQNRCQMAEKYPERQQKLNLTMNFRSRPEVLSLCNAVFRETMTEAFGGVNYRDGHSLVPGRKWEGHDPCELWLLDGGEDEERREEREARACAARISRLLAEETVQTDDGPRPVRPEDVAILLSSFSAKSEYFVSALAEQHIPCATGGSAFFGTLEIAAVTSLLRIVDNPRQDVPLVSALRSPLWLFSAAELSELRLCAPGGDLYDALQISAEQNEKSASFLRQLAYYQALSADLGASNLLRRMLDDLNAEAIFSALDNGAQRARNLRRLLTLALQYEGGGSRNLSGFLRRLDRLAQEGGPDEGNAEGTGVRLLSIHRSKGLEFPFVLLPDLAKRFNTDDLRRPVLIHTDLGLGFSLREEALRTETPTRLRRAIAARMGRETREEELRKLYVAMTRAKQKLILMLSAGDPLQRIARVAEETRHTGPAPYFLATRDNAMDWILAVLMGHPDAGSLRSAVGEWNFVSKEDAGCFSCHVLEEPSPAGAISEKESTELAGPEPDYTPLLQRSQGIYAHHRTAELPSKLTPSGVRRLSPESGELAGPVSAPEARMYPHAELIPRARKQAALRGTALHILLRNTDPGICRTGEDARMLIRALVSRGALTEEQAALCDPKVALSFSVSALGRRVLDAKRVLREYEFGVLMDAGELLQDGPAGERILMNGAIDLLLFEDGGLTVIDFKSDRVFPGGEAAKAEEHRLQLQIYGRAAEEVFGLPVREKLIWFIETGTAVPVKQGAKL